MAIATQPPTALASPSDARSVNTPARYRLFSLICLAAIAISGVAAAIAAFILTTSADRVEDNSAPVLIAVQDIRASLAEADSAATSVFLSGGQGDPQQQRLYEQAIDRAGQQIEEVARLIGDDEAAHDSLKRVTSQLTRYSGLVEASRLANTEGIEGAGETLSEALGLTRDVMDPELASVTQRARDRLDQDEAGGVDLALIATAFAALAVLILIVLQLRLSRATHRLLNPPLVLATLLMVIVTAWMLVSIVDRNTESDAANDGGYDSIAITSDIQTTAYRFNTEQSLALISGSDIDTIRRDELIAELEAGDFALLNRALDKADSSREQAAATEMQIRWQRYRAVSDEILKLANADDIAGAKQLSQGSGGSAFVGFNTAVESVLLDNREQFLDGMSEARNTLDWLQLAMIALPIVAALLALWGYQLRINEYR